MTEQQTGLTPEDLIAAIEECHANGWTDGLPVVPPIPSLVHRFLEHTDRSPSEVIWTMTQVKRGCTVQAAAINAAMASCLPEHFLVVLAALEVAVEEGWPGLGGWQTTTAATRCSSSTAPSAPSSVSPARAMCSGRASGPTPRSAGRCG